MTNFLIALVASLQLNAGAASRPDSAWVHHSAIYEIFVQDFSPSGDLRGVTAGLDRIKALGTNVIWLMPIQPLGVLNAKPPLGSPYALRDYRAINPSYGTADDFRALVQAAHARDMKVILDWVPDHTAWDHVWVTLHPDFYVRNERGELSVPRDPGGHLTDWTDVIQLNYANPEMRRAMIADMRYWLDEFHVDGFREDAVGFVSADFWREAIPALRAAAGRPIMMLAEWGDVATNGLGFDLTYAWDEYGKLKAVWGGEPASSLVALELTIMHNMPAGGARLRFSTNHDETAWDNPPVTRFNTPAGARAAFVAMALLPGTPLLYNGQEVESPQKLPLFERMPVKWDQQGAAAARAFYTQVLRLARTNAAFMSGDFAEVQTDAPADVIAYRRGTAIVLVNARSRDVRVVPGASVNGAHDLLSSYVQRGDTLSLPAYGAMVLTREPSRDARRPRPRRAA